MSNRDKLPIETYSKQPSVTSNCLIYELIFNNSVHSDQIVSKLPLKPN